MLLSVSIAHARLLVAVTVPAQAWLVKQIAGDDVDVLTLVPSGHVPESAQPGPRNLARFQQADILFTIGHPDFFFEARYINSYRKKSNIDKWLSMHEVVKREMPSYKLEDSDPHLWTSPSIMLAVAVALERKLSRLEPENAEAFRKNLKNFQEIVSITDRQVRALIAARDSDKLLVYHPAWGHFCQHYGLQQLAIEKDGKAPGAASLAGLFRQLEKNHITNIISSPGADQRISSMIADQFKINMVLADPMDSDWLVMMLSMKQALKNGSKNDK